MKKLVFANVMFATLVLTACGGGSDTPANFVLPANLQTTLATPTYDPSSEEFAAFNAINTFRRTMGLGYWNQSPLLDQAASNHMSYSIINDSTFQQDIEGSDKLGFTGTTPSQRAIHAGFFVIGNTINQTGVPTAAVGELSSSGPGADVINAIINTIYHRSGLLAQTTRSIGLARDTTGVADQDTHWWFSHGRLDGGQLVASNYLSNYPLNQQQNVPLSMTPEYPSVFANQPNFDFSTQTSSPISVITAANTSLTVTSFTVTQAGSSTPLPGTTWTTINDPTLTSNNISNPVLSIGSPPPPSPTIPAYEAHWVGNAPFLPNTTYNVSFKGSTYLISYGLTTEVSQNWSFTTGSQ